MSTAVNAGIERAHVDGVVTSASLMVLRPAAGHAASLAARHRDLGVGLHLDLGEWICRDGRWSIVDHVVPVEDASAVRGEIARQLGLFEELVGRPPTHLDSHQHVHLSSPVREALSAAGERLDVPVRGLTPRVRFCGDFYGQSGRGEPLPELITVDALLALLATLESGVTELGCHPGLGVREGVYRSERTVELRTLTDPAIAAFIGSTDIDLVSHHTMGSAALHQHALEASA